MELVRLLVIKYQLLLKRFPLADSSDLWQPFVSKCIRILYAHFFFLRNQQTVIKRRKSINWSRSAADINIVCEQCIRWGNTGYQLHALRAAGSASGRGVISIFITFYLKNLIHQPARAVSKTAVCSRFNLFYSLQKLKNDCLVFWYTIFVLMPWPLSKLYVLKN